jgi:hypothetical protein
VLCSLAVFASTLFNLERFKALLCAVTYTHLALLVVCLCRVWVSTQEQLVRGPPALQVLCSALASCLCKSCTREKEPDAVRCVAGRLEHNPGLQAWQQWVRWKANVASSALKAYKPTTPGATRHYCVTTALVSSLKTATMPRCGPVLARCLAHLDVNARASGWGQNPKP